jgi:hypothetical protein
MINNDSIHLLVFKKHAQLAALYEQYVLEHYNIILEHKVSINAGRFKAYQFKQVKIALEL